jgi:hypothetical protein
MVIAVHVASPNMTAGRCALTTPPWLDSQASLTSRAFLRSPEPLTLITPAGDPPPSKKLSP